jgi:hypothetical protein
MEDAFEIEVVANDGVWSAAFARRPGPADWADAGFVWLAVAEHPDGRRHASLWAISGLTLARLGKDRNDEALAELILAEYRRRFDDLLPDSRVVIEQADYNRLTSKPAEALERIGREIDRILFETSRRLPVVLRFGK